MAETDPAGSSRQHVIIHVEAAAAEDKDEAAAATSSSLSCVVCMEAMEWVAVSPCGHREVCIRCVALIRFFHNDRRCCICRSHCPTVVVTRASSTASTTQRELGGGFPFVWPPPPAPVAFGGQEVVGGVNYWYHRGMGAYFDDVSQYEEMSKVCIEAAAAAPEESGVAGARGGALAWQGAGVNQHQQPAESVDIVMDLFNVAAAPARQQADGDAPEELERPLSRNDKAVLVLPGVVAGAFILGAPLLYMIPT